MPESQHRAPWVTTSVAALALVASAAPGPVQGWLVYERQAILAGQVWRLWTGHLVHFSASHLAWDLLVVILAGTWIEEARFARRGWFAFVAPAAVSLALLVGEPHLRVYGGLSGLANGAVAFACASEWRRSGRHRMLWVAVLSAMGLKIAWEYASGATLFAHVNAVPVQAVPLCHLAGALVGAAFGFTGRAKAGEAPGASGVGASPEALVQGR